MFHWGDLTFHGNIIDVSWHTSLVVVLEMLQEQNRAIQEQYKAQQKRLLDMIGQQQEAHEGEEVEDSSRNPPKPTFQKLTVNDNFWLPLRESPHSKNGQRRYGLR